jgi:hypothetical protein
VSWRFAHTVCLFALVAFVVTVAGTTRINYVHAFYANLAAMTLLSAIIGHGVTGAWRGILIDEDDRISLSRFQMVLWTILIANGLATASFGNLFRGLDLPASVPTLPTGFICDKHDPLHIHIAENVWALMGLSATTAVGASLINQTNRSLNRARLKHAAISDASWADLFMLLEGSARRVDITRVQKFFFTVILVVAYGTLLHQLFAQNSFVCRLPELSTGMLVLLGISSAGYLAAKAVPRA